jgi:hypothetical protein
VSSRPGHGDADGTADVIAFQSVPLRSSASEALGVLVTYRYRAGRPLDGEWRALWLVGNCTG